MNLSTELFPPTDYYESTLDWVENSYPHKDGVLYEIYPEIPIPKVIKKKEKQLLIDKPKHSNKAFVVTLPKGRVLEDRAIISPDNKLLWDVSVEWNKPPREHSIFQENKLPPLKKTTETIALLTHPAAYNYYHWLLEALARIHLLEESKIKIDKYIVNHKSIPFQLETLIAFGIPLDNIIQPQTGFHLESELLVVPSYVNLPNAWSCNYVRNKLLPQMNLKPSKDYERIYIRRKDYRRVLNERNLLKNLKDYGFTSIELESIPLQEQISIFHSAKVIIAPHGAGLANLLFCKPKTLVIELFSPSFMEPHYWLLSRLLNLNYHFIVGKGGRPHPYWVGFENMFINPNSVIKLLKGALR